MPTAAPLPFARPPQNGWTLVDLMVGVVVGLLAILVIYRVFAESELLRRGAQSAGDAQQTGLFAIAQLAHDIGNAGAGIAPSGRLLGTCPATTDVAAITRPVAVLISDGGSPDAPDSVVVRYAVGNGLAVAAPFAGAAPGGSNFQVRSPLGIAAGDLVVAISRTGDCPRATVVAAGTPSAGAVDLTHSAVGVDLPDSARLLDLGPANRVVATRYDVVGGSLRSTDVLNGDAPNPIASNIVNLKLQYGIDTDGDGSLDAWVPAKDGGAAGAWAPGSVLKASSSDLARVKAVRVGLIVRAEQFDRAVKNAFSWVLFDCPETDKGKCPGRLEGTIPAGSNGGWHYRVYETVVPLRNQIWNPS